MAAIGLSGPPEATAQTPVGSLVIEARAGAQGIPVNASIEGETLVVHGRLTPATVGEQVRVLVTRGDVVVLDRTVPITDVDGGGIGTFAVKFRPLDPGNLVVTAEHPASAFPGAAARDRRAGDRDP